MGRIAQQTPGGWQYFLPDALGSVRQLTDATGALVLTQSFDPYGGLLSSQGTAASPYGFAGEWGDASGLIYLRARYYDPRTGHFQSRDPLRGLVAQPGTLNPYVYALNNPLRYTDPSGEFIESPLDIAFIVYDVGSIVWDVYRINQNRCHSNELIRQLWIDSGALALDLVFLALPGATGGGMGLRFALAGANVTWDVARAAQYGYLGLRGLQAVGKGLQVGGQLSYFAGQKHHPLPQYLLGPQKQDLYKLSDELHIEYHNRLDESLPRKLGKNFYEKLLNSTSLQAKFYDFLLEFNKYFDTTFGTHTYEALEDVLRNEGWLPKP